MTREALHELIERIPEDEIAAAQRFLEYLTRSAAFRATLSAPPDDEPITTPAKWFLTRTFSANSAWDELQVA